MINLRLVMVFWFGVLTATAVLSMDRQNMSIKIKDNTINLDKGSFAGDVALAIKSIQAFCDQNTVTSASQGHGWGSLTVNGVKHAITPYGIDIAMMLKFCNLNVSEDDSID